MNILMYVHSTRIAKRGMSIKTSAMYKIPTVNLRMNKLEGQGIANRIKTRPVGTIEDFVCIMATFGFEQSAKTLVYYFLFER